MKDINLLPKDYKEQVLFKKITTIQLLIFLVVLFFLIVATVLPNIILNERQAFLNQLEDQTMNAKYIQPEEYAEKIITIQSEVTEYFGIMEELYTLNSVNAEIYRQLLTILHSDVKINSFVLKSGICSVGGKATRRIEAAKFISRMETLPFVLDFRLDYISLENENQPVDFFVEIIVN